jgi:alpha-D-xyloside xylohydrolase
MKYKLMPYIYAQAKECTEKGLPMVRALFIEYPDDPGAWLIEDEYMFGADMLVAPLLKSGNGRNVYLPTGSWIDYQTKKVYKGGWHFIEKGNIDIIVLVRDGSVIPHIKLAQSTMDMDWTKLDLVVYATGNQPASGLVCLPGDNILRAVTLSKSGNKYQLDKDPLAGKVAWKVRHFME